jgi:hypothetical protein
MSIDEAGVEGALAKFRGAAQSGEKSGIAAGTGDDRGVERIGEHAQSLLAVAAMRDQLGDHRVVERRHLVTGGNASVDAQAFA